MGIFSCDIPCHQPDLIHIYCCRVSKPISFQNLVLFITLYQYGSEILRDVTFKFMCPVLQYVRPQGKV